MPEPRSRWAVPFAERLKSLVTTPEVSRLVYDVTACQVAWDIESTSLVSPQAKGLELFPCFTTHFRRHRQEVRGAIFPNLVAREWEGLFHVIRLGLPGLTLDLRLHTQQTTFLLSPFHIRFLSILFGHLVLHQLSLTPEGRDGFSPFTPYSLEEQVVAGYLQSLEWAPCATIKLDAHDNPYIGSMLHSSADLRRCEVPGGEREVAIIRAWRLFKSLLYYSVEGERLFTGFAFLSASRPLEALRQRWPSLLWFREDNFTSLDLGLQAMKQFLLNADGRQTFLAMHRDRIVGLMQLSQGTHRQLTTSRAWRTVLPLATISHRGRVSFWLALKGRKNKRIPLAFLEYRHGHLHIPLFQDVFWQELERQLKEVCPTTQAAALPCLKALLEMLRHSGHGAIFLIGLTREQLADPQIPLENQVHLSERVPLHDRWQQHLLGLAKSDGAVIFTDRLEACQFRARLKPAVGLPPDQDDLGSGMRHQVTREFSAYAPHVLGVCVSQDAHISLYRQGKLVSRLY
jgi:hypothetical protein